MAKILENLLVEPEPLYPDKGAINHSLTSDGLTRLNSIDTNMLTISSGDRSGVYYKVEARSV